MSEEREAKPATPAKINLAEEFAQSGVGPVLQQLDDELVGLAPVKQRHPRDRGSAAGRSRAGEIRSHLASADPAHELHRQSRHR